MFYGRLICRICEHNALCRTYFYNFADKKYIYFSIYSIKREKYTFSILSYGYPMGMLWLSYGINS